MLIRILVENVCGKLYLVFMDKQVKQFLESAVGWAAGGDAPTRDLVGIVSELSVPRISKPEEARDYLWQILSYPERGRALAMLNAVDLVIEIIPSWTAYINVQDLRLAAVEEVHLERWANGLSEAAFNRICRFHDTSVDGRLNGWALTALAALLIHEGENVAGYISSLRMDFTALEATDGEVERIIAILAEYPVVLAALAKGEHKTFKVLPATLIVTLATMFADDRFTEEQTGAAILAADKWLTQG